MAITTRTISNALAPLHSSDGLLLPGVNITFTLVDRFGKPTDNWDAPTGARILSVAKTVTTDSDGLFSVDLWPTSRGTQVSYYLCRVVNGGVNFEFMAPLPAGTGILSWVNFKLAGGQLAANESSAFATLNSLVSEHINNDQIHVTHVAPYLFMADSGANKYYKLTIESGQIILTETLVRGNSDVFKLADSVTGITYALAVDNGQLTMTEV